MWRLLQYYQLYRLFYLFRCYAIAFTQTLSFTFSLHQQLIEKYYYYYLLEVDGRTDRRHNFRPMVNYSDCL